MSPPALVKLSGKYPLNQQDPDLYSWRVSLYRETNYSPISCVLNSSKSSDFKGISLDLQLCKWEENQTPEKKKERPLSGYVDFLGGGKKVQTAVRGLLFFFLYLFFHPNKYLFKFDVLLYYWLLTIHINLFLSHVLKIYLFLIFLVLTYKNFKVQSPKSVRKALPYLKRNDWCIWRLESWHKFLSQARDQTVSIYYIGSRRKLEETKGAASAAPTP